MIKEDELINKEKRKICYARVSSHSQKDELENQKALLKQVYPDYELLFDIGMLILFNLLPYFSNKSYNDNSFKSSSSNIFGLL